MNTAMQEGAALEGPVDPFTSADERARFAAFTEQLVARGRRPATVRAYRSDWVDLSHWFRRAHGRPLDAVDLIPADVEAWREAAQRRGRSGATAARRTAFVRTYMRWLEAQGQVKTGASQGFKAIDPVPASARRPDILAPEQEITLIEQVEAHGCIRDQAVILTLLDAGLKVGELVALDVGHLDLTAGHLLVPGHRAPVPVPSRAAARLSWSLAERGIKGGEGLFIPPPPEDAHTRPSPMPFAPLGPPESWPLFVGERGRLSANGVQRIVRKHGRFARVDATPRVLRHTFAVRWLARRPDPVALAEVMGLESPDAARIYAELIPQRAPLARGRKAVEEAA